MKITIRKKYLIFPVNTFSAKKKMMFQLNGETVYSLNIKLDNYNPDFWAYIDMSRFLGREMELDVSPEMKISFRESDEMDIENVYKEPMRPQVHFTTKNGWINDPNGLIYLGGVYHMFYQYNPAEHNWDNMHWGHAVSRDLVHWEEKDTALFPDERGMMFSGSAFYDERNDRALLFYTTTEPFCQNISCSADGFETLRAYEKNPIVPHIAGSNRDPKVVFCDEMGCYIMALYLENGMFCILKSDNLTDWSEVQRIRIEGDRECPDIFPLSLENGDRKWVLMGANDRYLVGNFDDGKFTPEQSEQTLHYGNSGYAGQSFSNLPGGRVVRVVWDRWNKQVLPVSGFCGQMGIPVEMRLSRHEDRYYPEANPVAEIEGIYKNTRRFEKITVDAANSFFAELEDAAQLMKISGEYTPEGNVDVTLFGRNVHFDFSENEIRLGDVVAPMSVTKKRFDVTLVADRCSMEVFSDGGKILVSCLNEHALMDRNLPYLTVTSDDKRILNIEINTLESIWE